MGVGGGGCLLIFVSGMGGGGAHTVAQTNKISTCDLGISYHTLDIVSSSALLIFNSSNVHKSSS